MCELRVISMSLVGLSLLEVEVCHSDGRHRYSYLDLDSYIGVSNGSFSVGGADFSKSARRIRLSGANLVAELPSPESEWIPSRLGLNIILTSTDEIASLSLDTPASCDSVINLSINPEDVPDIYDPDGWSLWSSTVSAYLVYRSSKTRRHIDLNGRIGCDDGHFDPQTSGFAEAARNVSLAGTVLTAELLTNEDTWHLDRIDVGRYMDLTNSEVNGGILDDSHTVSSPPYEGLLYPPLGQKGIRLCQIAPGRWTDPIRCTMVAHDTSSLTPPYRCLSYVWGDATNKVPIYINGHQKPVTKNLYTALRRLRWRQQHVPIWIDALCINQDDLEEKSSQVSRIRDTYLEAERVLIWLGEDQPHSALRDGQGNIGPGCLGFLLHEIFYHLGLTEDPQDIPGFLKRISNDGDCDDSQWEWSEGPLLPVLHSAMEAFGDIEWFNRTWTVQEVTVARRADFLCGSFEMHYTRMRDLISEFWGGISVEYLPSFAHTSDGRTLPDMFICGCHKIISIDYLRNSFQEFISAPAEERWGHALVMLSESRRPNMTDPRDAAFAAIPLTPLGFGGVEYHTDYTLDVERVYQDFTFRIMEASQSYSVWDLVFCSQQDRSRRPYLPSWAIDWAGIDLVGEALRANRDRPLQFAHTDACASPRLIGDGKVLAVKGHMIDEVSASSRYTMIEGWTPDILREWLGFTETEDEGTDALWRTMTAGCMEVAEDEYRPAELRDKEVWSRWISLRIMRDRDATEEDLCMGRTASVASLKRRLARTLKGNLGLVWPEVQVGDVICMIEGTKFPYLLRQREEGLRLDNMEETQCTYELVGPCNYIHGIEDRLKSDWIRETEVIYLC